MAVSPSPSVTLPTKPETTEPDNPPSLPPDPSPSPSLPPPVSNPSPSPIPVPISTETTIPSIPIPSIPPFPSFTPGTIASAPPSYRPVTTTTQFSPVPVPVPNPNVNPGFQNPPGIQPPGVNPVSIMHPGVPGVVRPMYQMQYPNPYGQMPNGYAPVPMPMPQGTLPPPGFVYMDAGMPRYPAGFTPMVRPVFPPRPPGVMGMLQPMVRPPVPVIRGIPPVSAAAVRPIVPLVAPTEKPQTTVYVGKIASTVESDFILSLLRLCGPVKSWKRAQDPSNGTPRGFGFCEFESAEGVLRALRLLSKFSVDGQELVLNVNQATREYLERYVEKKAEREKLKETEAEGTKNEEEGAPGVEKKEPSKPAAVEVKEVNAETQDSNQNFGIVSDEDREADRDALEKLQNMLEERLRSKPLPPPPPPPQLHPDVIPTSNSAVPSKSRDGDSDGGDMFRNVDEKNDDEMTSERKQPNEQDLPDASSPERNRKYDRRSRERDRERDLKREKERELVRYEREREREKVRRDREKEQKIREADRLFKERKKEWESRERDMEHQRKHEAEKDKERRLERKRLIIDQEDESDDEDRKRRRRSSALEEKRKRRKREKEEDIDDRLREEEEVADAKRREIEEMERKKEEDEAKRHALMNGIEVHVAEQSNESDSAIATQSDDIIMKNGIGDDSAVMPATDAKQSSNSAPTRKLGFGLVGSGKRTAVPSVFHEEDEEDENKDKKMRPLVPIDYSTEELQAVQTPTSETPPPHLAAAAEFAKRISNVNPKDEERDRDRDRDRHSNRRYRHDEDRHRSRDRDEDRHRSRDEHRERDNVPDNKQAKSQDNKKLLDAKQLIDMIPKTKEELFSFEINWAVYDKHELHERMRPWISKKITEFLGEEETTLVDYIVIKTRDHVKALEMLELLQSILDDEAEMFVLKMWRMLIFEIKKVETGLAVKPKA